MDKNWLASTHSPQRLYLWRLLWVCANNPSWAFLVNKSYHHHCYYHGIIIIIIIIAIIIITIFIRSILFGRFVQILFSFWGFTSAWRSYRDIVLNLMIRHLLSYPAIVSQGPLLNIGKTRRKKSKTNLIQKTKDDFRWLTLFDWDEPTGVQDKEHIFFTLSIPRTAPMAAGQKNIMFM